MRGLVLAIALAAGSTVASAQEATIATDSRPPARPAQAEEASSLTPEAAQGSPVTVEPAQPDGTRPNARPNAQPAPTDTAPPPASEPPQPDTPAPAVPDPSGTTPPDTPAAAKSETPPGPPIRETLRENDFDYSACLLALHDLGVEYEELAPLQEPEQRDCGIARPIRVTQIMPGIALQGGAPMRCDTARALGFWVQDFVRPATARLPGAPRLTGMQLGTTYDCRGRVGTGEAPKLSEHAFGNAIDIAAFTFQGGAPIPVSPRQDSGDLVESFQRAVRGAACLYFTTVLGPGSNAAHDDHLHLDIAARNGGWRLCQ